jgi:predicted CoA-binding protein
MSEKASYTDISRLIAPRSVALVGASDQGDRFGTRVFRQLCNFGFAGPIYPINPRAKELNGRKCYPSLADLPETPDHVGIIVATERVFDVLEECAARGVPFATVYSAGFAEMGTPRGASARRSSFNSRAAPACASWARTATASSTTSTPSPWPPPLPSAARVLPQATSASSATAADSARSA